MADEEEEHDEETKALHEQGKKTRATIAGMEEESAQRGADIPNVTTFLLYVGEGRWRYRRVNSANSVITLQPRPNKPPPPPPPPKPGEPPPDPPPPDLEITRGARFTLTLLSTEAHTLAIVNGGSAGGTLYTFPGNSVGHAVFQWSGTDWELRTMGLA